MKTRESLTQLFLLACANVKPEDLCVFRYDVTIRDVKFEKSLLRICERPEGKSTLILIEEGKNVKEAIHNCYLTDEEHEQLKNIWERAAQLKFVIRWWKERKNVVPPQATSPFDLGVDVYYLKNITAFEIGWTTEVDEASKLENREQARTWFDQLSHSHPGISIVEIGINNN